jgi:diketogulonate reductase-like aldo/keto reductase
VQTDLILAQMGVSYVDLLLNHWPTSPATYTTDKTCKPNAPTYDAKQCRLNTWRALVEAWQAGQTRAIGVANYNSSHLQEIIDAGMPLPAVNQVRNATEAPQWRRVQTVPRLLSPRSAPFQVPFHLYNAAAQADIHAFCYAHNITLLSYSPMGIPDWHTFPTGPGKLPAPSTTLDPVLLSIAAKHAPATPGQVRGEVGMLWRYCAVYYSDLGPLLDTPNVRLCPRCCAGDYCLALGSGPALQPPHDERDAHDGESGSHFSSDTGR